MTQPAERTNQPFAIMFTNWTGTRSRTLATVTALDAVGALAVFGMRHPSFRVWERTRLLAVPA